VSFGFDTAVIRWDAEMLSDAVVPPDANPAGVAAVAVGADVASTAVDASTADAADASDSPDVTAAAAAAIVGSPNAAAAAVCSGAAALRGAFTSRLSWTCGVPPRGCGGVAPWGCGDRSAFFPFFLPFFLPSPSMIASSMFIGCGITPSATAAVIVSGASAVDAGAIAASAVVASSRPASFGTSLLPVLFSCACLAVSCEGG